ncbi:MAG: peptidylprolyl isomerase [Verrucomicrobiota bacterium]
MKKLPIVLTVAGFTAFALTCATAAETKADKPAAAPAATLNDLFPDKVVAKGKSIEIKRSEVDEAYTLLAANARNQGQQIPLEQRGKYEAMLLDRLVITHLLLNRATAEDKTKAKDQVEKFIADSRKRMPNPEMFETQIKALGMSMAQFTNRVTEQALCDEVVGREVRSKITISDADAKKYYDENAKQFEEPERVRAAHVLIGTKDSEDPTPNPAQKKDLPEAKKAEKRKLAESILERAKKGEDFGKLAKEFSDDPGSKDKGGEYTFGRGQMVPEFEAAAFGQEVGKISDVVTTTFGYHIIKTLEKFPAKKSEYAAVSEDIKKGLQGQEVRKQMQPFLEKMKSEAAIEILDESLKPVEPPKPPSGTPKAPASEPKK